jgi:hypothetical protein
MARDPSSSTIATSVTDASHMTLDRMRLLRLLDSGEPEPLTIDELRERGVARPGQAIYELELDGYPVERVHRRGRTQACRFVGYRLSASRPCRR